MPLLRFSAPNPRTSQAHHGTGNALPRVAQHREAISSTLLALLPLASILLVVLLSGGCKPRLVQRPTLPSGQPDSDYYTAMRLLITDTTGQAKPYLYRLVERYPEDDIFHNLLAREFAHEGLLDSATKYQQKATTLDNTNTHYLQQLYQWEEMKMITRQGDPVEISHNLVGIAKQLTDLDSTNGHYWYYLAVNYMRTQQPEKCIEVAKQHYKQLQSIGEIDLLLANAYVQLNQCDSTQRQLERMVQHSRGGGQEQFAAAEISLYCGQKEQAVKYYTEGLRYSCPPWENTMRILPEVVKTPGPLGFAEILRRLHRECEISPSQTNEAITLLIVHAKRDSLRAPGNLALLDSLMQNLPATPEYIQARYRFAEYVTPERDLRPLARLATEQPGSSEGEWQLRLRQEWLWAQRTNHPQDWQLAFSTAEEMLRRYPMNIDPLLHMLSRVYAETEGHTSSKYEALLDRYIDYYIKIHKRAKRKARAVLENIAGDTISVNVKTTSRLYISMLMGQKGDNLVLQGQLEQAWKLYDQALKHNPDNVFTLNNYAYFLATLEPKRLDEARKMSKRSLELDNYSNPTYLDTYGYILYLDKEYEAAREIFIKLLSINPNPGRTTLLHYSDVLRALGKEHAADLYKMKAENAPAE